jgi:hypothetical protein
MMARHPQFTNGYACAWRDCIEKLHIIAAGMNDPHAKQVLNLAASDLGTDYRDWKDANEALSEHLASPKRGQKP